MPQHASYIKWFSEIGLADVRFLPFRDSGMAGTPENDHPDCLHQQTEDTVAGHLTGIIRDVRPHVVFTWDPVPGAVSYDIRVSTDDSFNTILELGFASSIRKEWEWRISRGESTRNLAAFRGWLEAGSDPEPPA